MNRGFEGTAGPWEVVGTEIWAGGRRLFHSGGSYDEKDRKKQRFNRKIAAASPDLMAACQALIAEQQYFEFHSQQPGRMPGNDFYSNKFMAVVEMARAAIAKATGEGKG